MLRLHALTSFNEMLSEDTLLHFVEWVSELTVIMH